MPCNCRQGIGSHDHLGDAFARDTFGIGLPLNDCVDLSQIQIWNSTSNAQEAQRLFDPAQPSNVEAVCSDDDPELLLLVPLSSMCRIRGILIQGPDSDYAPKDVKIFANQPDIRGFDSVERFQAQEELQLGKTSLDDRIIYRLNPIKFSSVGCLCFHFQHSFNNEATHLFRIELFGENAGISTNRKLATNIVYELRPNLADHPSHEEAHAFVPL